MTPESSSRPPAEAALRDFAARSRDRAALRRLDAAAADALAAFAAAGIDALLLKGPALAQALYAPEHRSYSDVDLLVAPDRVDGAQGVLAALGYRSTSDGLGIDDVGGSAVADAWARPGTGEDAGLMIDLHWRLPGTNAPAEAAWAALIARRAWIDVAGARTPTLDAVGLAVHVVLHAAQHGGREGKPIVDLERATTHWPAPVWRDAAQLATQLDASETFAAGLRLTASGAALADDLALPASAAATWAIARRYDRPRGTFHLDALASAPTWRVRVSILRRSVLPTRTWIRWQYPWARHDAIRLALAYALHVLRTPLWALRAWRFRRARRRAGG